jgi:hypothetical protein
LLNLEKSEWTHLKCHFGGLAIQLPEPSKNEARKLASDSNPKAEKYDVGATAKASYKAMTEMTLAKYNIIMAKQADQQRASNEIDESSDAASKARQKVIKTLRESSGIYEVGDLFSENTPKGPSAPGTFAPIFFTCDPPAEIKSEFEPEKDSMVRKFYFVYNGRFLVVAARCQPDKEIFALSETVSKVCLLMGESGYEFHMLSPIPTQNSLSFGNVSAASSPTSSALNNSSRAGRNSKATVLVNTSRSVRDVLRSLYTTAFPYVMPLYSLKEQSDTEEALIQTIKAHRETILDLMEDFNKNRGYFHRRKLRGLIRTHCAILTDKIERLGVLSDSLAQGVVSLDDKLRNDSSLKAMFDRDPSWKSYINHEYDTKPVLDMIARTAAEIG